MSVNGLVQGSGKCTGNAAASDRVINVKILGPISVYRCCLSAMGITIINIDSLILILGIPLPRNMVFLLNWVPDLTHWGWVLHIGVSKLIIVGSDNGLSSGQRQATIWTNDGILLIGPLGTNFIEIRCDIHTFSFKKMHLKMSSVKWCQFCPTLNVLTLKASRGHDTNFIQTHVARAREI